MKLLQIDVVDGNVEKPAAIQNHIAGSGASSW